MPKSPKPASQPKGSNAGEAELTDQEIEALFGGEPATEVVEEVEEPDNPDNDNPGELEHVEEDEPDLSTPEGIETARNNIKVERERLKAEKAKFDQKRKGLDRKGTQKLQIINAKIRELEQRQAALERPDAGEETVTDDELEELTTSPLADPEKTQKVVNAVVRELRALRTGVPAALSQLEERRVIADTRKQIVTAVRKALPHLSEKEIVQSLAKMANDPVELAKAFVKSQRVKPGEDTEVVDRPRPPSKLPPGNSNTRSRAQAVLDRTSRNPSKYSSMNPRELFNTLSDADPEGIRIEDLDDTRV